MKELKAKVKLTGKEFEFLAIEHETEYDHHGNVVYITILRNGQQWQYINVRHFKYCGLKIFLINFLMDFYGHNLISITIQK